MAVNHVLGRCNSYWRRFNRRTNYEIDTANIAQRNGKRVKILIDLFIGWVPFIVVNGYQVVEPTYLLSLYKTTHSSKNCTAVKNAKNLIQRNINPVGRIELIGGKPSKWDIH
jgi:hypothetical protein